jgi:ectoine hydroxylase-related dioxygenase (phytanoyl-CoA dioxygenase family)
LLDGLRKDADLAIAEERGCLERGEERYVPVSQLDDRYVVTGFVRRSDFVRQLVFSELAASICRAALGNEAFLYSETFVCMAPHNQHGWIWHQDSSYLDFVGCGHYPPNLGVWVALDDATAESGALRVLPFSVLDVR